MPQNLGRITARAERPLALSNLKDRVLGVCRFRSMGSPHLRGLGPTTPTPRSGTHLKLAGPRRWRVVAAMGWRCRRLRSPARYPAGTNEPAVRQDSWSESNRGCNRCDPLRLVATLTDISTEDIYTPLRSLRLLLGTPGRRGDAKRCRTVDGTNVCMSNMAKPRVGRASGHF